MRLGMRYAADTQTGIHLLWSRRHRVSGSKRLTTFATSYTPGVLHPVLTGGASARLDSEIFQRFWICVKVS